MRIGTSGLLLWGVLTGLVACSSEKDEPSSVDDDEMTTDGDAQTPSVESDEQTSSDEDSSPTDEPSASDTATPPGERETDASNPESSATPEQDPPVDNAGSTDTAPPTPETTETGPVDAALPDPDPDPDPDDGGPGETEPVDSADAEVPAPQDVGQHVVAMSSLLDGDDPQSEQARDVDFDSAGNFVVVGGTSSPDFPTTMGDPHGGPDTSGLGNGGDYDVFVTKFDPDGNLLWSQLLGNGNYDRAYAVEVGPNDDIYIAGRAGPAFPTTPGVYQPDHAGDDNPNPPYGDQDGFVTRLDADGNVVWSTFVGESGRGIIRDFDVDAQGQVYLGMTGVTGPIQADSWGPRTAPEGSDGFFGILSADGASLVYGNYMGGSSGAASDGGNPSVRVTSAGDVYFLTWTDSADFSCVQDGVFDSTHNGDVDFVLARYSGGVDLDWCTFIGGSAGEAAETHSLALDLMERPVIAAGSRSDNMPTTAGVVSPTSNGDSEAYVAIVDPSGTELVAATYFGGTSTDWAEGVDVLPNGDIIFTGGTHSDDTPLSTNAFRSDREDRDGIYVRMSPDLTEVVFHSLIGGSGLDDIRSSATGPNGSIAIVGSTESTDFPALNAHHSGAPVGRNAVAVMLLQPTP